MSEAIEELDIETEEPSIVNLAIDGKASDFKDNIEASLNDRVQDALQKRKEELSQTMFSKDIGSDATETDIESNADANV